MSAGARPAPAAVAPGLAADGCAAPDQSAPLPAGVDLSKETVITGVVCVDGVDGAAQERVGGAYVRLLDGSGEFTAEVVSSDEGRFRFFAAPGHWTVRALSRQGTGEAVVAADIGLTEVVVLVSA